MIKSINTEIKSFYPSQFNKFSVAETTESVEVTSGDLTIGNVYFIKDVPVDAAPIFEGAFDVNVGTCFTATGTSATFDGATLVDVSAGEPKIINFYRGVESPDLAFCWKMDYNEAGKCLYLRIENQETLTNI